MLNPKTYVHCGMRSWQLVRITTCRLSALEPEIPLRLEAGFCLYGNELTEDISPYEAGLGWVTKLQKGAFVGREALQEIKASGPQRRLVGLVVDGRGIPRSGYTVVSESGDRYWSCHQWISVSHTESWCSTRLCPEQSGVHDSWKQGRYSCSIPNTGCPCAKIAISPEVS